MDAGGCLTAWRTESHGFACAGVTCATTAARDREKFAMLRIS
jgi:hypothetical protein